MNRYGVDIAESNLQGPLVSLGILYDNIPATNGCERCSEVNGDDQKDWCCRTQSPSMYYVEFLKVYKEFEKWSHNKKLETILRAVSNYLDNTLNKGCIFYDKGCLVYEQRPFSCRLYGVIPEENWNKRWEVLKARHGDNFESKPQCNLVSSAKEIAAEDEDKWFDHTKRCEERIGVSKIIINKHDETEGSYRTFHDHLLLELFSEEMLSYLTSVRMGNPLKEEIELIINELRKKMKNA